MDKAYRKYLIDNPDQVDEDDFSFDLLMDIFNKHFGYNCHKQSMMIGGYEFTCHFTPEFSNSGKSKDWHIRISSYEHDFEKQSKHHNNRRKRDRLKRIVKKVLSSKR